MILSNDGLVAFHYGSYGTFFYKKIGFIRSIMKSNQTIIRENHMEQLYFNTKLLDIKNPNTKFMDVINRGVTSQSNFHLTGIEPSFSLILS